VKPCSGGDLVGSGMAGDVQKCVRDVNESPKILGQFLEQFREDLRLKGPGRTSTTRSTR
jgi:hypothetical protein